MSPPKIDGHGAEKILEKIFLKHSLDTLNSNAISKENYSEIPHKEKGIFHKQVDP